MAPHVGRPALCVPMEPQEAWWATPKAPGSPVLFFMCCPRTVRRRASEQRALRQSVVSFHLSPPEARQPLHVRPVHTITAAAVAVVNAAIAVVTVSRRHHTRTLTLALTLRPERRGPRPCARPGLLVLVGRHLLP